MAYFPSGAPTACDEILTSGGVSIVDQAARLANDISQEFQTFLDHLPKTAFTPTYDDGHLCYVVVGGVQNDVRHVVTYKVVVQDHGSWRVLNGRRPRLELADCGCRFIGDDQAINGILLKSASPFDSKIVEMTALRQWSAGQCLGMTMGTVTSVFIDAVRLTVTHGDSFGVPAGKVGGPLEIWRIASTGIVKERVEETSPG